MSLALVGDRKSNRHPASKSLNQLPLMEYTFPPFLFLHRRPFPAWEGHGGMVLNGM